MKVEARIEEWELAQPFRIAGQEWHSYPVVVVTLSDNGITGRGEAAGVDYLGDTPDTMIEEIDKLRPQLQAGIDIPALQKLVGPGGTRNAIDCALWDLACKKSGRSIWELTGISPGAVNTMCTVSLHPDPEHMAREALSLSGARTIKVKADADRPIACIEAVHRARPDADLLVDANQSWNMDLLTEVLDRAEQLRVRAIEQPLPVGDDDELVRLDPSADLIADESAQTTAELEKLRECYQVANIKLDKTGGITEALNMARTAQGMGLKLMVGNMLGTSLAMAPAMVIAQMCSYVDLDGPLLNRYDRPDSLQISNYTMQPPRPELWG